MAVDMKALFESHADFGILAASLAAMVAQLEEQGFTKKQARAMVAGILRRANCPTCGTT